MDARIEVAVMDRGPGIAPEDLPHVFDRFYRARSAAGAEGLGLGLYIARRLVELQGGTIAAEGREGGGAVLRFTLAAAPAQPGRGEGGGSNPFATTYTS